MKPAPPVTRSRVTRKRLHRSRWAGGPPAVSHSGRLDRAMMIREIELRVVEHPERPEESCSTHDP